MNADDDHPQTSPPARPDAGCGPDAGSQATPPTGPTLARSAAFTRPVNPFARLTPAQLMRHGAQVALANFVIAGITSTLHGNHFWPTLVYSELIGTIIWLVIEFGRLSLKRGEHAGWPSGWRGLALVVVACAVGYAGGTTIADAIFGYSSWSEGARQPLALLRDAGLTALFCTVVAGSFWARSLAQTHRAQTAAAMHAATLARLGLLQSQLEPHMLFNTLANLRALIAADPERAQAMLDRLIDFLRATLGASRVAAHPLAVEFARVDDYLALMRVRMGERLHALTVLPPGLAAIEIPPLLLQPLVENAIKHGLEPQRGPGRIMVTASLEGSTLVLAVDDNGRGLAAAEAARAREPAGSRSGFGAGIGTGFGVAQVRERLQTLHGEAARFTLEPRPEGGTRAEIRLPVVLSTPNEARIGDIP